LQESPTHAAQSQVCRSILHAVYAVYANLNNFMMHSELCLNLTYYCHFLYYF